MYHVDTDSLVQISCNRTFNSLVWSDMTRSWTARLVRRWCSGWIFNQTQLSVKTAISDQSRLITLLSARSNININFYNWTVVSVS